MGQNRVNRINGGGGVPEHNPGTFVMKLKKPTKVVLLKPHVSNVVKPDGSPPDVAMEPVTLDVLSLNDIKGIRNLLCQGRLLEIPSFPLSDQILFYFAEQAGIVEKAEVIPPPVS